MARMKWMPQYNCWVFDDGRVAVPYSDSTAYSYKRVMSFREPSLNSNGYCCVYLQYKRRLLHRLLAEAFIPNPDNKPTVDHIDRNPQNNSLDNLRWATGKEQADNTRLVDSGLAKYGVRKCEDPKEYNKRWAEAHRDELREYKREHDRQRYAEKMKAKNASRNVESTAGVSV